LLYGFNVYLAAVLRNVAIQIACFKLVIAVQVMKKTQGQKRKHIVRIIAVLIFLVTAGAGVYGYQKIMGQAYAWVDSHAEVQATVTYLDKEVEEYRNRKGRKRTRTVYYMDYSFIVDGEEYEEAEEISSSEYNELAVGDTVPVWYDPESPYNNALESTVANGAATSPVNALITVVPIALGVAFFFNFVLGLLFVRESRSKLAEGFYTDDSWLDVDDNKLVLLNNYLVAVASFDDDQVKPITKAYQEGATHKELIALLKPDQMKTAIINNITSLHSRHDEDLILLAEGEKEVTLDFLNVGTKAHALEKLEPKLASILVREEVTRSRLRSAAPRLIALAILAAVGFYMSSVFIWFIVGFLSLVFVIPTLVRRLISPTVVTSFEPIATEHAIVEPGESDEPVETDFRKAA